MLKRLISFGVLAIVATAQDIPSGIKYDLTDLFYPRVARLARVQGIVTLQFVPNQIGGEVKTLSGPPMLVKQASDNLAKWHSDQSVTVSYIFKLADFKMVTVKVPKSDAFGRFFLRVFHLATYTEQPECRESPIEPTTSEPKMVQQLPLNLEIEIKDWARCLKTEYSLVASR